MPSSALLFAFVFVEGGVTRPPSRAAHLAAVSVEMLGKGAGVFDPLTASGGAAYVLGPGMARRWITLQIFDDQSRSRRVPRIWPD